MDARGLVGIIAAMGAALLGSCGDVPTGGNQPPSATITSPALGASFRAGDTLNFAGNATDPEEGQLPAGSLTWWADLHHDTHTHPFVQATAGGSRLQRSVAVQESDARGGPTFCRASAPRRLLSPHQAP